MLPTREEAEKLLLDAEQCNPGAWGNHSRIAAECAEKIAALCEGMDANKAYILGLLHDIGRKFGVKHFGHIYDGYKYMLRLGYDEVARICLTHSFNIQEINSYVGNFDVTKEEQQEIEDALRSVVYDDYDRLIQLCDAIAGAEGVMDIEARMADVKRRYGNYPKDKWDNNLALKKMFEKKMGRNIYEVVGMEVQSC
ncbi:MAG: HD domain-containing protein [Lachnospiraceae bacterium]|nr:HD domain-containing protein [Lachnospiraceae bacterium]